MSDFHSECRKEEVRGATFLLETSGLITGEFKISVILCDSISAHEHFKQLF